MVERRGRPFLWVMAIRARRCPGLGRKLAAVCVLVAFLTFLGRPFELRFLRAGNRLMASTAGDGPVRSDQRKLRSAVIESAHFGPGARAMAGFATRRCAVRTFSSHALAEFAVMRIGVARRAGLISKVEGKNFAASDSNFVAIIAGYGNVRSS